MGFISSSRDIDIALDFGNTANSIPRVLSYHTELAWLDADGNIPKSKHITWAWTCELLADGTLRVYDPQNGKEIKDLVKYGEKFLHNSLEVLRVDNLYFNPLYAGCIKGNKHPNKKK